MRWFLLFFLCCYMMIMVGCSNPPKEDEPKTSSKRPKKITELSAQYMGIDITPYGKSPSKIKPIRTQNRPDVGTGFTIILKPPGELVIIDPLGRKAGYDPISKTEYDEIPEASYFKLSLVASQAGTPLDKYIYLYIPPEGEYELRVIGTGLGIYDLLISAMDREGGVSVKFIEQMPISPNIIHTYILNYSREAGSKIEVLGAFDGKGQRPRDVNKFLSYSNPTQVTTELPAGSTTFDILIFYDQPIIPQTFKAELNRQDITNLFSPSAGGFQIVRITLAKGRNTLILSVDGTLASGRVATDTDRLVFIVP